MLAREPASASTDNTLLDGGKLGSRRHSTTSFRIGGKKLSTV